MQTIHDMTNICNKERKNSNNFGSRRFQDKSSAPFEPGWRGGLFWRKNSKSFHYFEIMQTFRIFSPKECVSLSRNEWCAWFVLKPSRTEVIWVFCWISCIYAIKNWKTQITLVLDENWIDDSNRWLDDSSRWLDDSTRWPDDSVDDWRMTGRWPMTLADDRSMTDDSVDDSMTQVDDPMTQVDDPMTQVDDSMTQPMTQSMTSLAKTQFPVFVWVSLFGTWYLLIFCFAGNITGWYPY